MLSSMNGCLFSLLQCIFDKKYPRLGLALRASKNGTAHDYIHNAGRVKEMQNEWVKYWRSQKIDFLISPGFASEATNHGSGKQGGLLATYTYIYNLLRMTACSQPVTVTREDERHYESDW